MQILILHPEFGAEVTDLDISQALNESDLSALNAAINQYSVLLFRDQTLDDAGQIDFSRQFGDLEEDHVSYYSHGEINYIGTVGNIDADGNKLATAHRGVRLQTANQMWHSDSSFRENPSLYSILYAYEVPDEGGETEFVSSRTAYQRLDDATKSTIEPLIGIHDYIYSRTQVSEDAVNEGQRQYMYPVRQKLVRTNPNTGDKNFYIGSHVRDIDGWERARSRPLLDKLTHEATRPESIYRHQWRVGDLVMWDNRCMLHRGCGYDADKYRRLKHQTRVRGAGPTLTEV
jgi:alpha-ketoglutarate-dependent 2,4-dichlorophenoxyacetate dioxygenase